MLQEKVIQGSSGWAMVGVLGAGVVTAVAGGALLVAGVIKLAIAPRASTEMVVVPNEGGASVLAVGRF